MMEGVQEKILSVTEFNQLVNDLLSELHVWVQGEVSDFRISQNKWVSFDLKDAGSRVNCFMSLYQLDQQLEDGMEIKVFGNPRVYVPYGKYSFNVQRVEPVGEGALRRAFELTKQKLEDEGLFSVEYKKPLPKFPETIGVITSEAAAAWTDFQRIINNRWSGLRILLRPSLVQGREAPSQLVDAIEWFNKYHPVDVLVLTRGGGSLEDLQAFNSEQVCRAVFASNIPIICGVGHERDITLAELVADVRASTPSNAAEIVVPDKQEIIWQVLTYAKSMRQSIDGEMERLSWRLDELMSRLNHQMSDKQQRFASLESQMHLAFQKHFLRFEQYRIDVKSLDARLRFASGRLVEGVRQRVDETEKLLRSYSPQSALKRGYAIARFADGSLLSSSRQVKPGQTVQTQLKDGAFTSEVISKSKEVSQNKKLF